MTPANLNYSKPQDKELARLCDEQDSFTLLLPLSNLLISQVLLD